MEKKRLVGIKIIGLLIIFFSILSSLTEWNYHEVTQLFKLPTSFKILLYLSNILSNLVLIGCGFLIIRLKEPARKITIILFSIGIIAFIFLSPFMDFLKMRELGLIELQKANQWIITQGFTPISDIERLNTRIFYISIGFMLLVFLFYIVCIFYLTRRRVKEQFR